MIVNLQHKFIHISIPRTATTCVNNTLGNTTHPEPHLHHMGISEVKPLNNGIPIDITDFFKFTFVRNPFDIAVSRYHWDIKGKGKKPTSKEGFNEWVKNYHKTAWQDEQWRYICIDGDIELDFIGRYENLSEDYNLICDKIGIKPPELGFQKSGFRDKTHYSKYYNQESIEIIQQMFEVDLELFNYTFEYGPDFKIINPKPIIDKNVINYKNINGPS